MATAPRIDPATLTMPQVESLIAVGLHSLSMGVSPGSVARARGLSRTMGSNVARTLDRLAEQGLVDYSTSGPQADPRYRLTADGAATLEHVRPSERGVFGDRDIPLVGRALRQAEGS